MWIDISQTLKPGIANWPGDTPFVYQIDASKADNQGANVGSIQMSLHIGTHLDAPYHYSNEGITIDELDINRLMGDAQVIELIDEEVVTPKLLERIDIDQKIVLFKSMYSKDESIFLGDFMTFTSEAIGTDMPSIDPVENTSLDAHMACLNHQILILENLELNKVRDGYYEFIGLPLKIQADASPVRAIVRRK
ncbi:cyclase family protein [Macrococcus animalis]|uniref:cyclase family protein n=1 Tax=Macrococcus animalis TaxID=3395467 RepID=UPI0039BE5EF7